MILSKTEQNWEVMRKKPTSDLVKIISQPLCDESVLLRFKMKDIQERRYNHMTNRDGTGRDGIEMYNTYIKPALCHLDTKEEYIKNQLWKHGGLISANSKWLGFHENINGHGHDLRAAYIYCAKGVLPEGEMLTGYGGADSINMISFTFDWARIKPQYKNYLPPMMDFTEEVQCDKFIDSNRIEFKKTTTDTLGRAYAFNNTSRKVVFYMFEEELSAMEQIYTFKNLTKTYLYHYKRCNGLLDLTMEHLYAERGISVNKGALCAAVGCLARRPMIGKSKLGNTYETWPSTYVIANSYITMKCRIIMINEAKRLADLGNVITCIATDCIYWIGDTDADTGTGLGSWSGYGDGLFEPPFCKTTKDFTKFDTLFLCNANGAGYDYQGYRIKTAHGGVKDDGSLLESEKDRMKIFMDVTPLKDWDVMREITHGIRNYIKFKENSV